MFLALISQSKERICWKLSIMGYQQARKLNRSVSRGKTGHMIPTFGQ